MLSYAGCHQGTVYQIIMGYIGTHEHIHQDTSMFSQSDVTMLYCISEYSGTSAEAYFIIKSQW